MSFAVRNDGLGWRAIGGVSEISSGETYSETPPAPVAPDAPTIVTMRQARLALLNAGLLTTVNNSIAAMAGPAGDAARIEWGFAATVDRNSPLVLNLSAELGLTAPQLDALFTAASSL